MKHFSEISEDELRGMWSAGIDAMIKYSNKIGMSGLSDFHHNIYNTIHDALEKEWIKSKESVRLSNL
jgi:hypothetical protein